MVCSVLVHKYQKRPLCMGVPQYLCTCGTRNVLGPLHDSCTRVGNRYGTVSLTVVLVHLWSCGQYHPYTCMYQLVDAAGTCTPVGLKYSRGTGPDTESVTLVGGPMNAGVSTVAVTGVHTGTRHRGVMQGLPGLCMYGPEQWTYCMCHTLVLKGTR